MEIEGSRKVPAKLINYFDDGFCVFALLFFDNVVEMISFDAKSFDVLSRFLTHYSPNPYVLPCVDDNCAYLPAMDGRLIGIDKFSGKILVNVDLGSMMIVSDPLQDDDCLFSLCGVPIVRQYTTDMDVFCICVNNKHTGHKRYQSQSMQGKISPLTLESDIWVTVGRRLFRYTKGVRFESSIPMNFDANYRPIIAENHIIVCSKNGSAEVFDQSLKPVAKWMGDRNYSSPVKVGLNKYVWFCGKTVYQMDLNALEMSEVARLERNIKADAIARNHFVYAGDEGGYLVELDIKTGAKRGLKISNGELWKPICVNDRIFISSDRELYQICLA